MRGGRLEIRLLGSFELLMNERPLPLGQPKQRAVLAALALHSDRPVYTGEIIDAVWGEAPPNGARNQIHVYVRGIRRNLGAAGLRPGMVETLPDGYRLATPADTVDLGVFRERMVEGRRLVRDGQLSPGAEAIQAALAVWHDSPLDGLPGAYFARAATALEQQRLAALEQHMRLQQVLGRHAELAVTLRAALEDHPFHEELRYGLMFSLHHCGRTVEALAVYREGRARTVDEFGIEPGHRLRTLERRLIRNEPVPPPAVDVRRETPR